jgi:deoxyhypusine synthase
MKDLAREAVLQPSNEMPVESVVVSGFSDYSKTTDYSALLKSFASTGFQGTVFFLYLATNMALAIEYINLMLESNAKIYLGYTSNMVSSGMRETFCYLAKHRMIDVIVTSAGGFEEGTSISLITRSN